LRQSFTRAIGWGVVGLILLAPLAVGSVEPWAFAPMEAAIFLLTALWLLGRLFSKPDAVESQPKIPSLTLPVALLAVLVAFQMLPLPPALEAIISPSTFELYQKSLPRWSDYYFPKRSFPAEPSSRSLVVLPTSEDIVNGAPVPFAKIGAQPGVSVSSVKDVSGPSWRSLSVDTSLTGTALLKLIAYVCLFVLVVSFPASDEGESRFARKLLRVVLMAGFLAAAVALLERVFPNGRALWLFAPYDWPKGNPWGLRATGPFANPDHLADYLDLVLPTASAGFLIPAAFANRRRTATKVICAATVIVIATALLLTSSRGGWLGALFGFAIFAALLPKESTARLPGGAGITAWATLGLFVLLVLLALGPAGRIQTDARLEETVAQNSIASRLWPAKNSLKMIQDFPVFGVGLGCWPEVFPRYSRPPWSPTFWNATHNDYVQLSAETGLLGFGLVVWFLAATLQHLWRGMRQLRPESSVLLAACLGGTAAVGVHELFDFPLQIPANAMLFTILLAIAVRITLEKPLQPLHAAGKSKRLLLGLELACAVVLISASITQRRTPYPYNLRQPATLAQAYALENAHPANSRVHLILATMLSDETAAKHRTEELQAALWLEPTNPLARDLYARTLLQANDRKEALAEIRRSVSFAPTLDSHFYLEPRMIPWLSKAERTAVELGFRSAVADHYEGALQNLARFYDDRAEFSAEGATYGEVASDEQGRFSRAAYFVDAGIAYVKARELKQAEASFRRASAAAPEDAASYEQLILQVFAPQNNLAAAKAAAVDGIEKGADPFRLYLALGSAAQASDNVGEAEAALQKAAAIRPSNLDALIRIGQLDLATNDFDHAALWLQKAVRLHPSSAEAFFNLGLANEGAYDYFAADQAYRRALALAPTDEGFKSHYMAFRQKMAKSERSSLQP
jgi:O-antigen ligase/tetratricopeptide (TPR) repeat protein